MKISLLCSSTLKFIRFAIVIHVYRMYRYKRRRSFCCISQSHGTHWQSIQWWWTVPFLNSVFAELWVYLCRPWTTMDGLYTNGSILRTQLFVILPSVWFGISWTLLCVKYYDEAFAWTSLAIWKQFNGFLLFPKSLGNFRFKLILLEWQKK